MTQVKGASVRSALFFSARFPRRMGVIGAVTTATLSRETCRLIMRENDKSSIDEHTSPPPTVALTSNDRNLDDPPGRCDNSHKTQARAAGNSGDTCRTSNKTRLETLCR